MCGSLFTNALQRHELGPSEPHLDLHLFLHMYAGCGVNPGRNGHQHSTVPQYMHTAPKKDPTHTLSHSLGFLNSMVVAKKLIIG